MEEKIGILIPMYNCEQYIGQCIQSIMKQTYNNLEIIIIDDGSKDNSLKICRELVKNDNRFKIYTRENKGVAFSRNEAINKCESKYFVFIDSDDLIEEDFIEIHYKIMKKYNVDMVSSNLFYFKNDIELNQKKDIKINTYVVDTKVGLKKVLYQYEIQNGPHCKLYKKSSFNNVEFPNGKIYEDLATIYKVVNNCENIAITNYNGYNYRYNPNSITKSKFKKEEVYLLECSEEIFNFINDNYNEYDLLLAAKNLLVTQCLFLAYKIPIKKEYIKEIKKIKKYIKKYRLDLLKSKETYPRTKFLLMASFLGLRGIKIIEEIKNLLKK